MRTVMMVSPLGEATVAYLLCLQKGARLYLKEGFSSVCDAEKFATYDPESGEYQQRALPTFISRRVFPQCVMQRSLLLMTQNLAARGTRSESCPSQYGKSHVSSEHRCLIKMVRLGWDRMPMGKKKNFKTKNGRV